MNAAKAMTTSNAVEPRETVEQLLLALQRQDMRAALAVYAPDAVWEFHVPGGEGVMRGEQEITGILYPWFIARDGYEIVGYQVIEQDDTVALRMEQHWRNAGDGAPCICHHSHFFQVADGRIQRQWMYCTGVNIYDLEDTEDAAETAASY